MTTTAAPPPALRTPRRKRRARIDDRGWLFVAPFAIVFALVFLAPLVYSIYLSLFREQLIGGNAFVGLDNYIAAFQDEKFWDGLIRVAVFLVIQVPIMLVLALGAALAIDSARLHASSFYRIVIFLPYAVPAVVAVLMWGYIYGDQFGLAGNINQLLGSEVLQPFIPQWMLLSIGNIVTWQFVGYNMLIFYSSLKTIPGELYEAASIDGAGAWRTIFSIKIPAVRGAVVIATIFSIIGSFQLFNEPNILKPLAPNTISTFYTPNMYAYNLSFAGQQYNYAATIAIIMGLITAIIAYVVQLRGSRQEAR
ncbi:MULTISPECIES: carbohydrate ABC transporter permease [Microbacterium]|uniref:carbohydrate ABC transporter permease n=1 Tax=Microbacterium TaxID=33882 RepID=UPI0027826AF0|nr:MULTISPECIES: sugar ABC transporter permease [Microbacterium]MDQ1085241.1 multiple sugar transport system permease protein [Microbacterium sp. SORGH_AS_0344]MDQ1169452.1 multiple sugar transport system permease protein [Microbacterium proteolyticum]